MSIDAAGLRKGPPPKRATSSNPITADDRAKPKSKSKPLQLMVPPDVFTAFSQEAARLNNFQRGGKSRLFISMWGAYVEARDRRPPEAD